MASIPVDYGPCNRSKIRDEEHFGPDEDANISVSAEISHNLAIEA